MSVANVTNMIIGNPFQTKLIYAAGLFAIHNAGALGMIEYSTRYIFSNNCEYTVSCMPMHILYMIFGYIINILKIPFRSFLDVGVAVERGIKKQVPE